MSSRSAKIEVRFRMSNAPVRQVFLPSTGADLPNSPHPARRLDAISKRATLRYLGAVNARFLSLVNVV
jgi:hypothetical protein